MFDSILFPTDGSEGSAFARDYAFELAEDNDAVLHVLHVVEAFSPAASLHETIVERMTQRGQEIVDSVSEAGKERGNTIETAVIEGDPAETIVEYAEDEAIDVIVMPTHGRAELMKAIVGSVTDKVIRTGDVPVFVLKYRA